ncbi:hypothetical protein ACFQL0_12820 [Haloplanus litoreus]|uniref:hypothetical protein n=1 Tax=Haloplanus litoreus TaxID=767515 RepID=UPI00360DAB2C
MTAEVTNAGATTGSQTVTLTLDGDPVAERRVELAPGASGTSRSRFAHRGPEPTT